MPNSMFDIRESQVVSPMNLGNQGTGWRMAPQYSAMTPWEIFLQDIMRNRPGLLEAYKKKGKPESLMGQYADYAGPGGGVGQIEVR